MKDLPAFPVPRGNLTWPDKLVASNGMTLRDYFAGQALIGFQVFVRGGWSGSMPDEMAEHVADNCYAIADAMLQRREE